MSRYPSLRHRAQLTLTAVSAAICSLPALASSHRKAPSITGSPKVDGTDFYMFNTYESGRGDVVTSIANYQPLQDPYGGLNYFQMDTNALYEVHVDNNGDAGEDLNFQFRSMASSSSLIWPLIPEPVQGHRLAYRWPDQVHICS